jgi:hypothetical protein
MLQQNINKNLAAAKEMLSPNKPEELLQKQQPQIKKRLLKAPILNFNQITTENNINN